MSAIPSKTPPHRTNEIAHERSQHDDREDRDHQQRKAGIELHCRAHLYAVCNSVCVLIGLRV